jgi:hypothetical protein
MQNYEVAQLTDAAAVYVLATVFFQLA